jgi:hypothetical protein
MDCDAILSGLNKIPWVADLAGTAGGTREMDYKDALLAVDAYIIELKRAIVEAKYEK